MQDQQALDRYWKTVVDTIQDGVMTVDVSGAIVPRPGPDYGIRSDRADRATLLGSELQQLRNRNGTNRLSLVPAVSIRLSENAPWSVKTAAWFVV